jgi:hypothetical protein
VRRNRYEGILLTLSLCDDPGRYIPFFNAERHINASIGQGFPNLGQIHFCTFFKLEGQFYKGSTGLIADVRCQRRHYLEQMHWRLKPFGE